MTPKQSIHRILALAALAATAFLSQALHAQLGAHASRVNVPFAFNIGSQHFTPGIYTIGFNDRNFLCVRHREETTMAMVQTGTEAASSSVGYLVFRKYGNRYFLAEYHPAAAEISAELPRSKTERSMARDYAAYSVADQGRIRLALLETGSSIASRR